MKKSNKTSYAKAILSKDENTGHFIITEISKDDSKDFDLTEELEQWLGTENIALSIGKDVVE